MPLWHKTKLIYSLVFQAVFLPSTEDLNKMVSFISLDLIVNIVSRMQYSGALEKVIPRW